MSETAKCNKICDYETDEFIDEERTAETVENDRAHIKGIKVRACRVVLKNRGIEIVEAAAALAHRLGLPLMVHIGAPGPTYESIASVLSEGDIITHAFHGKPGNLLESGKVPDWAWDAKRRGVLFDVGHGAASFDINVGRRAIDEGFLPDLIGTDLHKDSYRIAGKLEDVMTKILACSVPLSVVIESVTGRARRVLGIEDYNTGCDGKIADLTLFRLDNTPRAFVDSVGNKIDTENGIVAMYSIANDLLKKDNIPFSVLIPLIKETTRKATVTTPDNAQTGPAYRGDTDIVANHLSILDGEEKDIYELLSNAILKRYNK